MAYPCFYCTVPEFAPTNVQLKRISSTSARVKWDTMANSSLWNGIALGYEVQYRLKEAGNGEWTSVQISNASINKHVAKSLLKYRTYEFKVAARTSKGSGVFSAIEEVTTLDDGMLCNSAIHFGQDSYLSHIAL